MVRHGGSREWNLRTGTLVPSVITYYGAGTEAAEARPVQNFRGLMNIKSLSTPMLLIYGNV